MTRVADTQSSPGPRTPSPPPGPRTPSLVTAIRFAHDPHRYLRSLHRRFGPVAMARFIGAGPIVWVADPALAKQVLAGDPSLLRAGETMAVLVEPLTGKNSVITLDDEPHLGRRRLLLPPLRGESLSRWQGAIRELAQRDMETWPVGEAFALRPHLQWITVGVILRVVLGLRDEERFDRAQDLVKGLAKRLDPITLFRFTRHSLGPWSPWVRFKRARAQLDHFLYEEIAIRRQQADLDQRSDVLSLLLGATDADGQRLSDKDLRDELTGLLFAGYETTATALAWAFDLLLHNAPVLTRLKQSLADGEEYMNATIKEVLRLRPVVFAGRRVAHDVELAGYRIPAGTIVAPAMAALHYDKDLYPDPAELRPERFLAHQPKSYSWIPFGGGVRRCIGSSLATLEMRVVIRAILERADLRAAEEEPESSRMRIVVSAPVRDCRVVLTGPLRPSTAPSCPSHPALAPSA